MKKPGGPDLINEITRRQWLLRLGETVALAGVSGLVPETSLRLFGAQEQYVALPPGLYEPFSDDLVHALSAHKGTVPPANSETDYVQPGAIRHLQFFSPDEFTAIARILQIMLGNIDSDALGQAAYWVDLWFYSAQGVYEAARQLDPLHRKLAIEYFGGTAVTELENNDPGAVAREGMQAFRKLCLQLHNRPFENLDAAAQEQMIREIITGKSEDAMHKFFQVVRNEAIRGYYTSPQGLKELDYKGNAYYPYCPGCETSDKSQ